MNNLEKVSGFGENNFNQLGLIDSRFDELSILGLNSKFRVENVYCGCDFTFMLDKDFNVRFKTFQSLKEEYLRQYFVPILA